jgi:very-short-patch-repair endonuclease
MLWRKEGLVVELDGEESHQHRFEEDRDRDATLLTAGFPVLRMTWRRLKDRELREAERLHDLLDHRSTPAGPPA